MERLTARLTSTRFAKQVTREHEKGAGLAVPVSGLNVACTQGNLPRAISCHPCTESNVERKWFPLFVGGRVAGVLAGNKS